MEIKVQLNHSKTSLTDIDAANLFLGIFFTGLFQAIEKEALSADFATSMFLGHRGILSSFKELGILEGLVDTIEHSDELQIFALGLGKNEGKVYRQTMIDMAQEFQNEFLNFLKAEFYPFQGGQRIHHQVDRPEIKKKLYSFMDNSNIDLVINETTLHFRKRWNNVD